MKARCDDRANAIAVCESIGARFEGDIHQLDTYFTVPSGRLKLREAQPGPTELVSYHRPDVAGPKGCDYRLEPVQATLKIMLSEVLGVEAVVDKLRSLYLWKNVRIHLDTVKGLGSFIEFEAVLDDEHDDADGVKKLAFLIEAFKIGDDAHQEYSYLELVTSESRS
tara:strand:- start:469 stop:966 length:498 start_codon:yes stop_codon:yes gene_type:complete